MTRYQSGSNSKNWQPVDIVSMALVYENRQESYRDLEINGKATKKRIEDLSGSWSTGEFGSCLLYTSLMSLMLGLSIALGSFAMFAQDSTTSTTTTKKKATKKPKKTTKDTTKTS